MLSLKVLILHDIALQTLISPKSKTRATFLITIYGEVDKYLWQTPGDRIGPPVNQMYKSRTYDIRMNSSHSPNKKKGEMLYNWQYRGIYSSSSSDASSSSSDASLSHCHKIINIWECYNDTLKLCVEAKYPLMLKQCKHRYAYSMTHECQILLFKAKSASL